MEIKWGIEENKFKGMANREGEDEREGRVGPSRSRNKSWLQVKLLFKRRTNSA